DLDARSPGQGQYMDYSVGGAAQRKYRSDGIIERGLGQDVAWLEILPDHIDNASTREAGHFGVIGVDGRDRTGTGKRKTQHLRHAGHRGSGSHGHASTGRACDAFFDLNPRFAIDNSSATVRPVLHHVGTAAKNLAPPISP